jgi:small ligand-binding sensory domain FIST
VSLGVTAGGVLGSGFELENRPGIALLTARLGGAWFQPFTYQQLQWSSQTDAQQLRAALLGPHADAQDIAAVILLADPFSTPAMHLIPAINEALPRVPVIGGMASGASDAGENRLFLGEQILSDGAVGVVIGGQVRVDCIVSQGCRPIGDRWVITKARQNIIQDLGQRPAMTAIQSTAQQVSHEDRNLLEEHGILLGRVINEYKERFGRGDFLIRNIIGADPDAGYIAVSDFVRVGQTVQFHVRDARTAEEDLKLLLESEKLDAQAAGALLFTCNGRGSRLFEEPNFESTIIRQALGDVPLAGFFAAGEIGPIAGENFIHGFTASLVLFRKV